MLTVRTVPVYTVIMLRMINIPENGTLYQEKKPTVLVIDVNYLSLVFNNQWRQYIRNHKTFYL